ncbi:MAG: hypothetical protein ACRET7_00690 [Burkholderiales bacterium]
MQTDDTSRDVRLIEELLVRQYQSVHWAPGEEADWAGFAGDFLPGTELFPGARPVKRQTVAAFIERMNGLRSQGKLVSLKERFLGCSIHVFGNVAVALAACEMLENGSEVTRDVSAFLLVKEEDAWRIASPAWDAESDSNRIPGYLTERQEL